MPGDGAPDEFDRSEASLQKDRSILPTRLAHRSSLVRFRTKAPSNNQPLSAQGEAPADVLDEVEVIEDRYPVDRGSDDNEDGAGQDDDGSGNSFAADDDGGRVGGGKVLGYSDAKGAAAEGGKGGVERRLSILATSFLRPPPAADAGHDAYQDVYNPGAGEAPFPPRRASLNRRVSNAGLVGLPAVAGASGRGGGVNMSMSLSHSQSIASSVTGSSIRTVSETPSTITWEMRWVLLAVIVNGILIYGVATLQNNTLLNIDASLITHYGGVLLEVVLLISNVITMRALKQGAAVVFGYLLCSKRGFSLAACGFLMTPPLGKLKFAQSLSLTSPARKILQRISFLWIVGELLKLVTPFCAVSLYSTAEAAFNDLADCVYFTQDPVNGPVDRGFPTFQVEAGVGEYVFGNSIGTMRSQDFTLNVTTAILPPTLIAPFNDGDTIQGPGFTAEISSRCVCARNATQRDLENAGVDPSQSVAHLTYYRAKSNYAGMSFGVLRNGDRIRISNVIMGYPLCGGASEVADFPMVCLTDVYNHRNALVDILFRTDGSVSSIAPNFVSIETDMGPADIGFLEFAFNAVLEGPTSYFRTPPLVPGSITPLLWWATPNLNNIDRALLDAGMETMYAVLFKAALQRTYQSQAYQCARKNVVMSHISSIKIGREGLFVAGGLLSLQLLVSMAAVCAFGLWFLSPNPIGPAVRATREYVYLLTLLAPTQMTVALNDLGNAETYSIWQELDVIARIGESIHTLDNPIGQLIIDKPNMVRPIQNGRKYT